MGTPAYVYDAETIRANYRALKAAIGDLPHEICYSVKCNSNYSILRLLHGLGVGVDIVSGGELYRSLRAGFDPSSVVFSGVGKTREELRNAIKSGVGLINVESDGELQSLISVAEDLKKTVDYGLRVNPDVTAEAHPYTSTGHGAAKFGVALADVADIVASAQASGSVRLRSVGVHIGSQITDPGPYARAVEKIVAVAAMLREKDALTLDCIGIGGGFGIGYAGKVGMDLEALFSLIREPLKASGLKVLMEPGRSIVGSSGFLVSSVLYCKRSGGTNFAILDAAMNDLLRPSLYQAEHGLSVLQPVGSEEKEWDFVGPVCESGDFLALGRTLSGVAPGALVAIEQAGAYGFSMSSHYNSRRRPAEVLLDGERFAVIRTRDEFAEIVTNEVVDLEWENRD